MESYVTLVSTYLAEFPGAPVDVTTFDAGPRWISVRWTPTSSGSGPVLRFILYIRNVNESESFSLVATLDTSDVMSNGSAFTYNVSREGVVMPFSRYSFRVESCNEIGCGEQSLESDIRQTDQDSKSLILELQCSHTWGQ